MRQVLSLLLLAASGLAHGAALPLPSALDTVKSVVVEGTLQLDIEAGTPGHLRVRQAACESALVWDLQNGLLRLSLEPASARCDAEVVQVDLGVRSLEELVVHDRAEASVSGLAAPWFRVETDSSGDVDLEGIECDQLEIVSNGSGDITASGRAARQHFKLSGDGDANSSALAGNDVYVLSSGGGDIHVNAASSLTITSTGSAEIRYAGHPRVQQRLTGSGSVSRSD